MLSHLFVLIGPSGSGKTTIVRKIMENNSFSDIKYNELVSFTTRPKRAREVDGVDYQFITQEEFDRLLKNEQLVEYDKYKDSYYGITDQELQTKMSIGHTFFIATFPGYLKLKEVFEKRGWYGRIHAVFISVDLDTAKKRMAARGDEQRSITERIKSYHEEMKNMNNCDYVIGNDENKDMEDVLGTIIMITGRATNYE